MLPRNKPQIVSKKAIISSADVSDATQARLRKEFFIPSREDDILSPCSSVIVPSTFSSVEEYINVWSDAVTEHLNLQIWSTLRHYHTLIENADLSTMLKKHLAPQDDAKEFILPEISDYPAEEFFSSSPPVCDHDISCKVACVRKPGINNGRYFYACSKRKKDRCKFFQWAVSEKSLKTSASKLICGKVKINNERSLTSYLKRNGVNFYSDCEVIRKCGKSDKPHNYAGSAVLLESNKKQYFLRLPHRDRLLMDAKDSLWLISKSLNFEPSRTVVVKLLNNVSKWSKETQIQSLGDSLLADWGNKDKTYALMVTKATVEFNLLTYLRKEVAALPILPHLLSACRPSGCVGLKLSSIFNLNASPSGHLTKPKPVAVINMEYNDVILLANHYAAEYKLNSGQLLALSSAAEMMKDHGKSEPPLLILDGVPGSGKSYLISVIILFLYELMTQSADNTSEKLNSSKENAQSRRNKWKILLTAPTDAKVDRVLNSLLQLGFDRIARVGDLGKIHSSLLPHSVHCTGGSEEQLKKLKEMLSLCEPSDPEAHYIKKSVTLVECGATKRLLHNSFVVGVTCEGSLVPSLGYYKFPVVFIDGADEVSEPLTLLPLARFGCEKLLLAGDTNSSFKPTNQNWFSNSLFQRIQDAGQESICLTSQFCYHSVMTSLLNDVFYQNTIINDVSHNDKAALVKNLPRICMYNVAGQEEMDSTNDFHNSAEAKIVADFTKFLLSHGVPGTKILVLTKYLAQVNEIKSQQKEIDLYDMGDVRCVCVTTQDHCDVEERDIAVISCVRSTHCLDAMTDREIISMVTRATSHVIIIANVTCLESHPTWRRIIEYLKQRKGVQSSFQFRNLSRLSESDSEVPFRALNPDLNQQDESELVDSHQSHDSDHDLHGSDHESHDENLVTELLHQEINDANNSSNIFNSLEDDLPRLRHKRNYFRIDDIESYDDEFDS